MRRCPKCGKESGDEFYGCPECGATLLGPKSISGGPHKHEKRNSLVAVGVIVVVIMLAIAFLPSALTGFFLGSVGMGTGSPTGIEGAIFGNRSGGYTVVFFLTDTGHNFVLSRGNVSFSIHDMTFGRPLYSTSFGVARDEFQWLNVSSFGVYGPGYLWKVPPGAVQPPQVQGLGGLATITFIPPSGINLWIDLNLRGDNLASTGQLEGYYVQ